MRLSLEQACAGPGALRTLFQPIVDLARGTVVGYEALTRIDLEPRMTPDRWFGAAYAAGCGPALEARALRSALAARPALPENTFLSVNVGPEALLAPEVRAAFAAESTLRGLVIELTEQAAVEDYPRLDAVLGPLRAAGALVAVDDAGAGYASLKHVMALRPDFVKLDRGLITDLDRDETKAAVVDGLGHMASRLDAWVIAEGVETQAELDRLTSLGIPLVQGYLLGRPAAAMRTDAGALTVARARAERRRTAGPLGPLLAEAVCIAHHDGPAAVAETFDAEPQLDLVVLVDEHRQPVGIAHRDRGAGAHARRPAMCTGPHATLGELAHRIVAREPESRFDPLVCCDERGRVLGVLRVERVLQALAER